MSGLSKHRLALSLTLTSAFFTGHLLSAQEATPAPVADASPVTATEAYEPAPQAYEAPQVYEPIVATETKSCHCCSTPCCTKKKQDAATAKMKQAQSPSAAKESTKKRRAVSGGGCPPARLPLGLGTGRPLDALN